MPSRLPLGASPQARRRATLECLSSTLKWRSSPVNVDQVVDDQPDLIGVTPPAARRRAGQHARANQRRLAHRAIAKVVGAFSLLALAVVVLGFGWATFAIEVAVVVGIAIIDRTESALVARWGRGAAGEEFVGEVLDGLRERGLFALHDVQLRRGNIDHVLVGPAGIFTIETKSHRGRLRAAAIETRMLKQAYGQAKSVEQSPGSAPRHCSSSAAPT